MAGGNKFSKLDVSQAFLHMEVKPEHANLLTLNTHKGLFKCTRLLYGLASAPAIWQREMESILSGISGVSVFLDDIKITGKDDNEHLERLQLVLNKLETYNIHINKNKCEFLQEKIQYCGYEIDKNGIHKVKTKIDAINKARQPTNVTELRAFLGLVQYYGRFFKNLSTLLHPLNNLLRKDVKFVWTKACERSFREIKQEMHSDKILAHYDPNLPILLATDASPYGVGAVISHIFPNGDERPIQFASQTLTQTQRNYSQIDKEAYSIIFGVRRFYQYLYGRRFILYTDHKPLIQIFNPNKSLPPMAATRMQHYALYLQAFNYDIRYKNTKQHANADCLSRLPLGYEEKKSLDEPDVFEISQIEHLPITVKELAKETEVEFPHLLSTLKHKNNVGNILGININEFSLQQGCIMRSHRTLIPSKLRKHILDELHTAHLGINKMKSLARGYCWWPNIDKDIENICKNCYKCSFHLNNPRKMYHPWEEVKRPFERVHIDFAGPFMGNYFFILVDAFTKWPEVHILKKITSENTITILREIFARFGLPFVLVSDNGPQLTSYKFREFLRANGIMHKLTAPYNPSTNGLAERYVQTLKQALRSMNSTSATLEQDLCKFLLHYRKSPHSTTNESPSKLMFDREIRSRLDLIKPNILKPNNDSQKPKNIKRVFNIKDRVVARDYFSKNKWKLGTIIKQIGELHFLVELDIGTIWRRHVNQLIKVGSDTPKTIEFCVTPPDRQTVQGELPSGNSINDMQRASTANVNNNDTKTIKTTVDTDVKNENVIIIPDSPILRRSERTKRAPERYGISN